jgi:hypothetical protein
MAAIRLATIKIGSLRTLPGGRIVDSNYDSCGRLERELPEAQVDFTYGDPTERVSSITRTATDSG